MCHTNKQYLPNLSSDVSQTSGGGGGKSPPASNSVTNISIFIYIGKTNIQIWLPPPLPPKKERKEKGSKMVLFGVNV